MKCPITPVKMVRKGKALINISTLKRIQSPKGRILSWRTKIFINNPMKDWGKLIKANQRWRRKSPNIPSFYETVN